MEHNYCQEQELTIHSTYWTKPHSKHTTPRGKTKGGGNNSEERNLERYRPGGDIWPCLLGMRKMGYRDKGGINKHSEKKGLPLGVSDVEGPQGR